MKKLFALVGMISVSLVANATSVQLPLVEFTRTPIRNLGSEVVSVRILDNGQVHGYRSNGMLAQGQWRQLATLPASQVARIRQLILRAQKSPELVPELGGQFHCAAVPMNQDRYAAPQYNLVLEQSLNPCGSVQFNDTRSSLEIVQLLNTYRAQLNAPAKP